MFYVLGGKEKRTIAKLTKENRFDGKVSVPMMNKVMSNLVINTSIVRSVVHIQIIREFEHSNLESTLKGIKQKSKQ